MARSHRRGCAIRANHIYILVLLFTLCTTAVTGGIFVCASPSNAWSYAGLRAGDLLQGAITSAIDEGCQRLDVSGYDASLEECRDAYNNAYRADVEPLLKVSGVLYSVSAGSDQVSAISISYYSDEQQSDLAQAAERVVEGVGSLTAPEKAKVIHDRIINLCEYDYGAASNDVLDANTPYDCLVAGSAFCSGYADAFLLCAKLVDVDCVRVASATHAWNLVEVDGNWYHLDATWDDDGTPTYDYFLRGDGFMATVDSHEILESSPCQAKSAEDDYPLLTLGLTRR